MQFYSHMSTKLPLSGFDNYCMCEASRCISVLEDIQKGGGARRSAPVVHN